MCFPCVIISPSQTVKKAAVTQNNLWLVAAAAQKMKRIEKKTCVHISEGVISKYWLFAFLKTPKQVHPDCFPGQSQI